MDNSLERLTEKVRRMAAGQLTQPVEIPPGDPYAELARALNQLAGKLDAARAHSVGNAHTSHTGGRIAALEQFRNADRLTAMSRLASGISHELGTPMNVVSVRAELILESSPSEEVAASAKVIKAQIDKMTAIIRQLLDFARRRQPRKERTDLSALVDQTIRALIPSVRNKQVEITYAPPADRLMADLDPAQIRLVLTHLIANAAQAMPSRGTIDVRLQRANPRPESPPESPSGGQRRPDDPRDFARIDVRDAGVGISADNLGHIFDPFFTTREVGEGTGLGLSIAYGIVQDHGGWLDVESVEGQGSLFSVFLPLGPQDSEENEPTKAPAGRPESG